MKRNEPMHSVRRLVSTGVALAGAAFAIGGALAQSPASSPASSAAKATESTAPDAGPLAPLAWLEGCWRGSVNKREFREHWMPLRGNLLVGVSQTVVDGKTTGFEFMRIEPRADGIFYVASPSGKSETAFRLAERSVDGTGDRKDEIFVFVDPAHDFPQKITYRRASEGWLYAVIEGKVGGADRLITYPMRRIGCESGELILK